MTTVKCKHEEAFWDDDQLYCPECNTVIGLTCLACGGAGVVEEDEYEGDWINCTDELIICPECHGKGWVKERMYQ